MNDVMPHDCPTGPTAPVLKLPDGQLIVQFVLIKHDTEERPWRHPSVMIFSDGASDTWPCCAEATNDPQYRGYGYDQIPGVLDDGRILDVFWTFDNYTGEYLNIHSRKSDDVERTWSPIRDIGAAGQPGPPVSLADGRVAMPYVDRSGRSKIKLRVSRDHGPSWPDDSGVVFYESTGASQNIVKRTVADAWLEMFRCSVGLPQTGRCWSCIMPGAHGSVGH